MIQTRRMSSSDSGSRKMAKDGSNMGRWRFFKGFLFGRKISNLFYMKEIDFSWNRYVTFWQPSRFIEWHAWINTLWPKNVEQKNWRLQDRLTIVTGWIPHDQGQGKEQHEQQQHQQQQQQHKNKQQQ